MSDAERRSRRPGARSLAESPEMGGVGAKGVRKLRGLNKTPAGPALENAQPSLLQPEVMPAAEPVKVKPRLREQALPEKPDHRFFDRWMLDRARVLGERAVKIEALKQLAKAGRQFAKWRSLRHPVAAERENAADVQTVAATDSRITQAKDQATRYEARAVVADDKAKDLDRDASAIDTKRLSLRPALRGSRIDAGLVLLGSLVVLAFDLVVLHLVLGETPGNDREHWITATLIGSAAVLAGEVLGWVTATATIDANGTFHRPSRLPAAVIAALLILAAAFFIDLGAFRGESLQRIALEDGLSIPDPSFLTLGQILAFIGSASLCFSYIARGRGRELRREHEETLAQGAAYRSEATTLRGKVEQAHLAATEAPVLRDVAAARLDSRRKVADAEAALDIQQGEYLDPLLDSEYKVSRADTEIGILYWTISERVRTSFAQAVAKPGRAAVAALLAAGVVFAVAGSLVAAGITGLAVGAALLLTGRSSRPDGQVVESEQARPYRAEVEPLATDGGAERATDIARLVPYESNGHHGPIDPDDLKEVVDHG